MSRTVVAVLGVLAAIALILVQFLPWAGVEADGFGGSAQSTAYTWKTEGSFSGFGFSGSDKTSWYSDDLQDDDGETPSEVQQIRIAIPVLLGGLLLVAVGALLAFLARGPGALLILVGGILAAIATGLFGFALDGMYDSDQDWAASFYLAIAASALAVGGGIVGMAGGRGASS